MTEHTLGEYINGQRIASLFAFGPIEGIHNTVELLAENELIKEKKSKLSARNRTKIISIMENAQRAFDEDSTNGDTKRWDSLQKLLEMTQKLSSVLAQAKAPQSLYT